MTDRTSEPWIWDQYWHGDRVALCFDAQQNQYDDDLAGAWRAWFANFGDGAALLDLCTGNGALPLLALEAADAGTRTFALTGVDYAAIDPETFLVARKADAARVSFQGGIDVGTLPFESGSFQGVSSQYGIEYSDLGKSLTEAARVLAPGGRGRFLLHAREGTVSSGARDEVARIDTFLATSKVFETARRAIKARLKTREKKMPSPKLLEKSRTTETRFREAVRSATGATNQTRDDFVRNTLSYLVNTLEAARQTTDKVGEAVLEAQVEAIEAAILAHRGRLDALANAAINKAGCLAITKTLEATGLTVAAPEPASTSGGRHIGWVLEFSKPG